MTRVTKVNRMEMKGFKSFNKKVEIDFGEGFNCVLGPNGAGKCVTGDTLVQLSDGSIRPIRQIVDEAFKEGYESLDDGYIAFSDGTEIMSMNPQTLQLEAKPIQAFVKRTAPEKLLRVKTRSGRKVTATPYHPLFTLKNGKIECLRADELKEGTRIAVPRNVTQSEIPTCTSQSLVLLQKIENSDILWDEIVELEEVQSEEPWVYDLCVSGNHNFVANNIIVHNSNVFDALIFVLGKSGSKGMRAEKTANLIYNGGKTKTPAKQGEVAIFFDNSNDIFGTGTSEVEIRRVVKQDGSSKYIINGETRTRTQVTDLLSRAKIDPDSHNIVLQGDIVHLVEMSPVERRGMVEEIAGISIYEDKKEKALRELNRVEEKLNEAAIILTERKSYLKELKKERDQALKFKELDEKIKRNKATLLDMRMKGKKADIDAVQKKVREFEDKIGKLNKEIEKFQGEISKRKKEADDINREIEEKGEKEQVRMHKQVEQLRVDLAVNEQRLHTLETELQKLKDRKQELDKSRKETDGRVKEIKSQRESFSKKISLKKDKIEELDKKISQHRKKNNLEDAQDVDKRLEEIDKEAEEIQETVQSLRESQQKLLREKDTFEVQLQGIDEKIERVMELEDENREAIEQLKKDKELLKVALHELNEALARDSEVSSELDNARLKLSARREELSKMEARSASIREGIAGGKAVSEVLKLGWKGVHGTVAQLGKVDSDFSLALETAAGGRLNSIVVEDDAVAENCINHLKDKRLGVATFLPLNKLKPGFIPAEIRNLSGKGIHGLALELVDYDKKYEKAFQYVFGSTLVVENVSSARKVGIGKTRMVTKQGDLMGTRGSMQGGHREQRKGLGFQDKEVAKRLKELREEISDLESVATKLQVEKKELESRISGLREEKAGLEGSIIKAEKSLHLDSTDLDASKDKKGKLKSEIDEIEEKLSRVQKDVADNTRKLTDLKMERQKLREQLSQLRNPAVLAELNSFEEKKSELNAEIAELRGELKAFDSELENVLLPEKESIDRIVKQHEKEEQDFNKESDTLKKKLESQKKELKEMEEKEKKFYSKFKSLFEKRQKLGEEITKKENDILVRNDKIRENEKKKNETSLENARLKAELSALEEENKQFENISVYRNKDEVQIRKEVEEFEKMASGIGAVNMKALEIYEQVENEYNKLMEKKEKLSGEREDVLVMINKIDSRKKELFMKTFESLDKNFKRIFSSLSRKGDAELELEDNKDPFNGGVNIRVRLTGKKYLDIRSLSGGEKTLTALSFIFAVQEYEPAPFYVMDEVDAALDKRNSEKLANLLLSYSDRAQYIIISHNDSLISEADNLYGVSMNEHGESKVTSLKI